MSERVIVALHGAYGVGKDTVADSLVTMLPNFQRIGFGDALWDEVDKLLHLKPGMSKNRTLKSEPMDTFCIAATSDPDYRKWMTDRGFDPLEARTTRFHAIEYGGNFLLRVNKLRWVEATKMRMDSEPDKDYVISDLRTYDDLREYHALAQFAAKTDRHFLCIELTQPGKTYTKNKDNARLPEILIHASIANLSGQLGITMGKLVQHIQQTTETA